MHGYELRKRLNALLGGFRAIFRVAIVGVGNCAASLVQGVEYYRDADPTTRVPGLMHVSFGDYHVRDIEFVAAFDVDAKKVGRPLRGDRRQREQHHQDRDVPPLGVTVQRGPPSTASASTTARRSRSPTSEPVDVVAGAARRRRRRARLLPAGRLRGGRQVLRAVRDRRRRRVRQRAAGVHRLRPGVGGEVHRRRRADRRRRHQEPGRRHHHPPRAGQAVRGPRRRARPHLPAQRRRQHGLQEHARARAAGVQEDLQDPVGHLQVDRDMGKPATCTSARRTTCRGSTTASGPTSGSRAARSATCR
jgi:hypothetical protein